LFTGRASSWNKIEENKTTDTLRPRSHDTGMEFWRQKIITVSTVHKIPADYIPL
jgi:hypothetical protein